jgi:hypothetical protein
MLGSVFHFRNQKTRFGEERKKSVEKVTFFKPPKKALKYCQLLRFGLLNGHQTIIAFFPKVLEQHRRFGSL